MGKRRKARARLSSGRRGPAASAALDRWLQLAVQAHQRGASGEALTYYSKIVAKDAGRAPIWHALGGLHYQAGDYGSAIDALEHAVALEPGDASFLNDLGGLYLAAGQLGLAERSLRAVVDLASDFGQAHYNLAGALYQQGKIAEAIVELDRLIAREPGFAEAHFNLGIALRDLGKVRGALEAFERSAKLQPDNERIHLEAAKLQSEAHFLADSIASYRRYLEAVPGDALAVEGLAQVLHRNGQTDEAILTLEQFSANRRPDQRIGIGLAGILHNAGRIEDAQAVYLSVLKDFPEAATAAVGLARLRRFADPDDPVIARLHGTLTDIQADDDAGAPIHFALGKVYDDLGQFDIAFRHYALGNEIRSGHINYDKAGAEARVEQLLEVFSASLIECYKDVASPSEKPVLIVGMPRSGTTLTEQIIASHKDAAGAGELAFLTTLAAQLAGILSSAAPYPRCWRDVNGSAVAEISGHYSALLERHSTTALRVTDKLPGNYFHIGLFRCLFTDARIIVCRRDARDVALSIYFQYFSGRHEYAWSLADIAHCFVQQERLVEHWFSVVPKGMIQIDYADLIGNTEETARGLIDFIGLDWDQNCLNFHTMARDVKTASNWQVRQPIYTSSLARWRHYRAHLEDFSAVLGEERARFGISSPAVAPVKGP